MSPAYCPGQDRRFWTHDDIGNVSCPACKTEIEFFKDDGTRKCPNCGTIVKNPRVLLSCASWCAYAEECIGTASGKKDSFDSISAAFIHWLQGRGKLGKDAAVEMYNAGMIGDAIGEESPYPLSALKLTFILCQYISMSSPDENIEQLIPEAEDFLNGYAISGQIIVDTAALVRNLHDEWLSEAARNPEYLKTILNGLTDSGQQ